MYEDCFLFAKLVAIVIYNFYFRILLPYSETKYTTVLSKFIFYFFSKVENFISNNFYPVTGSEQVIDI